MVVVVVAATPSAVLRVAGTLGAVGAAVAPVGGVVTVVVVVVVDPPAWPAAAVTTPWPMALLPWAAPVVTTRVGPDPCLATAAPTPPAKTTRTATATGSTGRRCHQGFLGTTCTA
jgi:hypothetical protein